MKPLELSGKRFGKITVLHRVENTPTGQTRWLCKCDCGTVWVVKGTNLKRITACKKCGYKVVAEKATKHGGAGKRLYAIYRGMKNRCLNQKNSSYKHYGGRGIKICKEWLGESGYKNFESWALSNGYFDDSTIDRINVNEDYCPQNCRWIPLAEQANNKTVSRMISYNGETKTLSQWSKEKNINANTLRSRLGFGMTFEEAISKPVKAYRKRGE